MFSIVRNGPHIIVVSPRGEKLERYFTDRGTRHGSLRDAFSLSDEERTVVLFGEGTKPLRLKDIGEAWDLRAPPETVLMDLVNTGLQAEISHVRNAPHIVIVRALGNVAQSVARAKKDFSATSDEFAELFDAKTEGTILCFTNAPLGNPVGYDELWPEALHVEEEYRGVLRRLRIYGLRYLNEGIEGKDWYDLDIKIYDRYESYDLQLERINFVMNALEAGFVTGESWSVDNPRMFMTIDVYRLRFFTYENPLVVKKTLLGLEYFRDGTRVGDYDLLRGDRKVHWSDALGKGVRERKHLGLASRAELEAKLTPSQLETLMALDERLRATRKD